jgi:DNA modification methylase
MILIQGDCLKILPTLPDESVDLILTDPPYNKKKDYEVYKDNLTEEEYWEFMEGWIKESFRILKNDGFLCFSCSQEQIWIFKPLCEKVGFRFDHLLIWSSGECKAHLPHERWLRTYEPFLFLVKGEGRKLNNEWGYNNMDVFRVRSPHKNSKEDKKYHPTQKPLKVMENIVAKASERGMIVLDPFLGSGTTMVACRNLKRNCIGIEINKNYIDIIKKRLNWNSSLSRNIQFEFFTEEKWFELNHLNI